MRFGKATAVQSAGVLSVSDDSSAGPTPSVPARLLCHIARWAQRRSVFHNAAGLERTIHEANYRAWRYRELGQQLTSYFDVTEIEGKDVLDFGCGTGEMCTLLSAYKPRSLIGVDKSTDAIDRATILANASKVLDSCHHRFACNGRQEPLPLESESVDLVCCFDVIEHIPDMHAMTREWWRVMRHGARLWVWWSPWRGPYGHHFESLMPMPWIHLLFPERTLFAACAKLYEDPDFVPRMWDRDPITGAKKPNKWRNTHTFYPVLNQLTRRKFEQIVQEAGLTIARHETYGFRGSRSRRATRVLLPIPWLGECFVSFYVYELTKR
ncbi:MAG: methyltransferase domain-containing protein [Phycisphaerae bacterium]